MSEKQTEEIVGIFDEVAGEYDGPALRFFASSAADMVNLIELEQGQSVLDVACGTGRLTLPLAKSETSARVTAIDLSEGMLNQARLKAAAQGVGNVSFLNMDMTDLGIDNASYDLATCAFGIFFVAEMVRTLRGITAKIRSGGRIWLSTFTAASFQPYAKILVEDLEPYAVKPSTAMETDVKTIDGCVQLCEAAGLEGVSVIERSHGYHLTGVDEWWEVVTGAAFRGLLNQVPPEKRGELREAHLARIAHEMDRAGRWLEVGVLYSTGVVA